LLRLISAGAQVLVFWREDVAGLSGSSTWGVSLRCWGWVVRSPGLVARRRWWTTRARGPPRASSGVAGRGSSRWSPWR